MGTKTFERTLLGSTAILVGAAGGAAAQDFSGLYSGVSLSFAIDGDVTTGADFFAPGVQYALEGSSGGLFAGYNFAQGNWIFGGELGWDGGYDLDFGGGGSYGSLDDIVDVRARAGYVYGNTMIYGALGLWKGELNDFFSPVGVDADGMSFGLGFETAMGPKSFLGAEIMHRNGDADDIFGLNYVDDIDLTTASIRAGFRF